MVKVVIKIVQGSAVTQTMLGGLTIYPPVANFLQCIVCQKLWKLAGSRQSYGKNSRHTFLAHPLGLYDGCVLPGFMTETYFPSESWVQEN